MIAELATEEQKDLLRSTNARIIVFSCACVLHLSSERRIDPPMNRTPAAPARNCPRGGQVLIEFALIAFMTTFLLAAVLTFGFLLFGANVLQQAADVGAMELSRHPFAAAGTFEELLDDVDVKDQLYDEARLVVAVGTDLNDLPLINRMLFPLYIYDPDIEMLRYPGALATNDDTMSMTVLIPILDAPASPSDPQTIREWRSVVEEAPFDSITNPYAVQPGESRSGIVALRINYPYQSGAMIGYRQVNADGDFTPLPEAIGQQGITNVAVPASDATVSSAAPFPGDGNYTLVNADANPLFGAGTHRGQYGLGEVQAFATEVRPYRKLLSAQGIYRREVLE